MCQDGVNPVTEDGIVDQEWQFSASKHPNPTSTAAIAAALENPGFGTVFSDHMVTVQWTETDGWHDAAITERKPFLLDPAAAVLHYAQEIFEGLKAYKTVDLRHCLAGRRLFQGRQCRDHGVGDGHLHARLHGRHWGCQIRRQLRQ
jgi:hypothetical protein